MDEQRTPKGTTTRKRRAQSSNTRRITSLLLVFVLIATLVPTAAFAAGGGAAQGTTASEQTVIEEGAVDGATPNDAVLDDTSGKTAPGNTVAAPNAPAQSTDTGASDGEIGTYSAAQPGDVELKSFTIANTATAAQSTSTVGYATHLGRVDQVTVRGTYRITRNDAQGALVEITLKNLDEASYFDRAPWNGNYNYFNTDANNVTWPTGSSNQTVTQTADGVVVSFTVDGNEGDSGDFTIGYSFDQASYGGWLPANKLIAEVTTDGHILAENKRTVTAAPTENNEAWGDKPQKPEVGLDERILMTGTGAFGGLVAKNQWALEPGTNVTLTVTYPQGAVVELPAKMPTNLSNGTLTADTSVDGTIVFDFGVAQTNGLPDPTNQMVWQSTGNAVYFTISNSYITFPAGTFTAGTEQKITYTLSYTLAGTTIPKPESVTTSLKLVEDFIHVTPMTAFNTDWFVVDSLTGTTGMDGNDSQNLEQNVLNGGTLPVPNFSLTWINDVEGSEHVANVTSFDIKNVNVSFYTEAAITINGPNGARTVTYVTPTKPATNGSSRINVATALAASGDSIKTGEYIKQIVFTPLDDTSGTRVRALPKTSGMGIGVWWQGTWANATFPNGDAIEPSDITWLAVEASWEGESRPGLHTQFVTEATDNGADGYAMTLRTASGGNDNKIYWVRHSIYPTVSIGYNAGEAGSKEPGSTINMTLSLNQSWGSHSYSPMVDPIIWWIPPECVELDMSQEFTINRPGATVTVEETTLDGRRAYKFSITGFSQSMMYNNNTTIPLVLTVKPGTLPGSYQLYNNTSTPGLLFATTETDHMYLYRSDLNLNTAAWYKDTKDLDNNPQTTHLSTGAGPSITVSTLSKANVSAELLDKATGLWSDVDTPGAQTTIETVSASTGQFRLMLENAGNTYLGDIKLLDILPSAGNGNALNTEADMGSEWDALLAGDLTVNVYDADGTLVSTTGNGTIRYSTNANPSYNGGADGIQRTGGAAFANNGTSANAKSFLYESGGFRLAPGHTLEIVGTVKAPSNVTSDMAGDLSYNSFAVQYSYYTNASGGTATPAGVTQPVKQEFMLVDAGDAVIENSPTSAFVFRDYNANNVFDGTDVAYAGVTIELWSVVNGAAAAKITETTTNSEGRYEFTDLLAGSYVIKIIKPTDPTGGAYAFASQGTGTNASHVDAAGLGTPITLTAGQTVTASTNAGIQATGTLTVRFMEGTTPVGSDIVSYPGVSADPLTDSVTAGSGSYTIPSGYHLVDTSAATQNYNLSWSAPSALVEFAITANTYSISYSYTGTVPPSAPTVPATVSNAAYNSAQTVAAAPVLTGYSFSGWTTTSAGVTVSSGGFTMPDNAVVFTGSWIPNTNTAYRVEHYKVTAVGPSASTALVDVDLLTGTSGALAVAVPKNYTGYTLNTSMVGTMTYGYIAGNGSLVLKLYYVNNPYTITYKANGGVGLDVTQGVRYNASYTTYSQSVFSRAGYTFVGWNTLADRTGTSFVANTNYTYNVVGNTTLYAQWDANTNTAYRVEHYKVSSNGTAVLADTENLTGTTDTTVAATTKAYTGYSYNASYPGSVLSGTVTGNGSLVLKLYYTANPYTITYEANGGTGSASVQNVYYNEAYTTYPQDTFTRTGYTFAGWNTLADGSGLSFAAGTEYTYAVEGNTTLYAQWDANTGTAYVVEHYLVVGGTASLDVTENRTGTTDTTATASVRVYDAYAYDASYPGTVARGTIAADGSLVLKLYYTQKIYTVTFVDWDGTVLSSMNVAYGGAAVAPADPTRAEYTFASWDRDFSYIISDLTVTALYTPIPTYVVNYFGNGNTDGSAPIDANTYESGESASVLAAGSLVRTGYTFLGWTQDAGATAAEYAAGDTLVITSNVNLYAVWDNTTTFTPGPDGGNDLNTDTIEEAAAPLVGIFGTDVPLFGADGASAWSLFDLICAILAVILMLVSALRFIRARRTDDDEDERFEKAVWNQDTERYEYEEKSKHRRLPVLVISIAVAVLAVILFIITQDMTQPMVFFDRWSLIFGIGVVLAIVAMILVVHKKKEEEAFQNYEGRQLA